MHMLLIAVQCTVIAATETDFASFSHDKALAYSQQAIGTRLQGIELIKPDGSAVSLENYRGKPLVLSMILHQLPPHLPQHHPVPAPGSEKSAIGTR